MTKDVFNKGKYLPEFIVFIFGTLVSLFVKPAIQHGLTPSQILNGMVRYPENSFLAFVEVNTFSFLKYLGSLLLQVIPNEITASYLLGAISAGLAYLAIYLFLNLYLKRSSLSILATIAYLGFEMYPIGFSYPIMFMGSGHTFGEIGWNLALISMALLLYKHVSIALVFSFLTILIHPAHGLWLLSVYIGWSIFDKDFFKELINHSKVLIAGIVLSVLILSYHFISLQNYALMSDNSLDLNKWNLVFKNYLQYWEHHRRPVYELVSWQTMLTHFIYWIVGGILFFRKSQKVESVLNKSFALVIFIGGLISLTTALFPEYYPSFIIRPMPMRFTNYLTQICHLGILGYFLSKLNQKNIVLFFIIILSFKFKQFYAKAFSFWLDQHSSTMLALLLVLFISSQIPSLKKLPKLDLIKNNEQNCSLLLSLVLSFFIFFNISKRELRGSSYKQEIAQQYSFLQEVGTSAAPGLFLLAPEVPISSFQLMTRRALVFNPGAFDDLSYSLTAIAMVENILNKIYDVSLNNDPYPNFLPRPSLRVTPELKELWQNRSTEQWKSLSKEFKFCSIATSAEWSLQLDLLQKNDRLAFWALPECRFDF